MDLSGSIAVRGWFFFLLSRARIKRKLFSLEDGNVFVIRIIQGVLVLVEHEAGTDAAWVEVFEETYTEKIAKWVITTSDRSQCPDIWPEIISLILIV